jgi:hypothetical protein
VEPKQSAFQTPITIFDAVNDVHSKKYLLPAIQREFVWKPEQIIKLFDSLLRGYPIGSFLFWNLEKEKIKDFFSFKENKDDEDEDEKELVEAARKIVEEYDAIKHPTAYHRLAYRYELDGHINRLTRMFGTIEEVYTEFYDLMDKKLNLNMPPIIHDKMVELTRAWEEKHPKASVEERQGFQYSLFEEKGEFHGLFHKDGTIDEEWLDNYLSNPNNQPKRVSIPFTDEMEEDAIAIMEREDLSDDEKDRMVSAMFALGGKYEGYIQADGSVDESKIVSKRKQKSAEIESAKQEEANATPF